MNRQREDDNGVGESVELIRAVTNSSSLVQTGVCNLLSGSYEVDDLKDKIKTDLQKSPQWLSYKIDFNFGLETLGTIEYFIRNDIVIIQHFSNINLHNDTLNVHKKENYERGLSASYIGNLKVHGLGRYMFEKLLEQEGVRSSCKDIKVTAESGSGGFYEKLGFEAEDNISRYTFKQSK